jgi:hypothetical protein
MVSLIPLLIISLQCVLKNGMRVRSDMYQATSTITVKKLTLAQCK